MTEHPSPNPYAASAVSSAVPSAPVNAREQLLPAAIGLLVTSILHNFAGLFYFAFVYTIYSGDTSQPGFDQSFVYCMYYGIGMLYSLVIATGTFSMLRKGSYLWAVTTCILAIIPLSGACFIFHLPFGIWGLIVLRRPEVRSAFARM